MGDERGESLAQLAGAKGVVVKIGGNVLMPRGADRPNTDAIEGISSFARRANERDQRLVVLPGGFAGQVVVEWARELGSPDLLLNDLGCTLVNIAARILADALSRRLSGDGISVAPIVAASYEELHALTDEHSVTVSGVLGPGSLTSDSLAILVGSALGWPVLLVKRQAPFRGTWDGENLADTLTIKVADLLAADHHFTDMRPGSHPSLDIWALHLLRRDKQTVFVTTGDGLSALSHGGELSPVIAVEGH